MTPNNEIELEINPIYAPFIEGDISGYRYLILYGGRGSGKTEATAIRLVRKCIEQSYFKCLLIREYYTNVKDSNFAKIVKVIEDMGVTDRFKITTSPLEITCKDNGNKFLARGLDNPSKLKSTENPTDLWLEEADATKEPDFRDLDFTLRSDKDVPIEIIMTFNPYDENHWIIKRFFPLKQEFEKEDGLFHLVQSTKKECYILHTTFKDNTFAGKQYTDLMAVYEQDEPEVYKVDGLGLFGEGSKGLVYPKWKAVEEMQRGDTIIGVDYGNVNPSAVMEISYVNGEIFVNELFYKSGYTQRELASVINEMNLPKDIDIYYDSAEPSLGLELDALGLNSYPADKGAGSVIDGIKFLKRYPLNVTKSSENYIKELRNYKWKSSRHGEILDNQPIKAYDHANDAVRYGVYTHARKWDNWISTKETMILDIKKGAVKEARQLPSFNFKKISKLGTHRPTDDL